MTNEERKEIEAGLLWEAERRRRMNYKRRVWAKDRVEAAILVALIVGFLTFLYFWNKYQPEREEKAYQEGVAAAEDRAASVGGWENWVELKLAGKEVR